MIQAVSSLKVGNSKGVLYNCQGNDNYISRCNASQSADIFTKSKNVSFTGLNPLGLIKGKRNLTNEAMGITKKVVKELPVVKRSLIAAASDLIHELGDTGVTVTIPLPDINVTERVFAGAHDMIVPHIQDLAGEALKEGASVAGHEVAGALVEHGMVEHTGHGIVDGIMSTIHEIITNS